MGLNYGQQEKEIQEFVNYYHTKGIEVAIHKYSNRIGESRYQPSSVVLPNPTKRHLCHWPFSNIIILYDGSVTTCYYDLLGKNIIGNLADYKYSIINLWNSLPYNRLREKHIKLHLPSRCRECTDWVYENPEVDLKEKSYVTIYPIKGIPYKIF